MRSWIMLLGAVSLLGGCMTAPTSVVHPPEPPVYSGPQSAPASGAGPYGSGGSWPAPTSSRRAPTVAYSDSSTGVPAADSLLREGKAQHQRGQFANAANNFERAIRMAPRSPALYLAMAKTRLAMQDYNNAIQMANRSLSLLPSDGWGVADARADAWSVIANAREASGDRSGAAAAREKARTSQ